MKATATTESASVDGAIKIAAREWLIKLEFEQPTAEDVQRFELWREADSKHAAAYARFEAIWRASTQMTDLESLEPLPQTSKRRPSWLRAGAALAAGVAAIAMIVYFHGFSSFQSPSAGRFATSTGELRTLKLADGSTVELGARSSVTVAFNDRERRISLTEGEAFFAVAHNPQRPFIVTVADKEVRALGTAFEVRRQVDGVHVVVTEGAVQLQQRPDNLAETRSAPVAAWVIRAGQELKAEAGAVPPAPQPVSQSEPAAWRHGRMVYVDAPLREVIADANRYSERPIVIADAGVAELGVSVTYASDRLDAMFGVLERTLPVQIDRRAGAAIVIKAKASPTP